MSDRRFYLITFAAVLAFVAGMAALAVLASGLDAGVRCDATCMEFRAEMYRNG